MPLQIERTPPDGVLIIAPPRLGGSRGFFPETWNGKAPAHAPTSFRA